MYQTLENMLTYRLKYKGNTENVGSKILKFKNGRTMLLWKCVACSNKKSILMKEQVAKGLLDSLGLKTPLNKIPLLCNILFWTQLCSVLVISIKWMK